MTQLFLSFGHSAIDLFIHQGPMVVLLLIAIIVLGWVIWKFTCVALKKIQIIIDELKEDIKSLKDEVSICHTQKETLTSEVAFLKARVQSLERENERLERSYNQLLMELSGRAKTYLREVVSE